ALASSCCPFSLTGVIPRAASHCTSGNFSLAACSAASVAYWSALRTATNGTLVRRAASNSSIIPMSLLLLAAIPPRPVSLPLALFQVARQLVQPRHHRTEAVQHAALQRIV